MAVTARQIRDSLLRAETLHRLPLTRKSRPAMRKITELSYRKKNVSHSLRSQSCICTGMCHNNSQGAEVAHRAQAMAEQKVRTPACKTYSKRNIGFLFCWIRFFSISIILLKIMREHLWSVKNQCLFQKYSESNFRSFLGLLASYWIFQLLWALMGWSLIACSSLRDHPGEIKFQSSLSILL